MGVQASIYSNINPILILRRLGRLLRLTIYLYDKIYLNYIYTMLMALLVALDLIFKLITQWILQNYKNILVEILKVFKKYMVI